MSPVFFDRDGERVELGEGRGDLRRTSMPFAAWDGSSIVNGRPVSYARLMHEQQWVFIAVMRLLTWAVRVPLKTYRVLDSDGARVRIRSSEHRLAAAIGDPWRRGSMADLVQALLGPVLVHGNSLMHVDDGARGKLRFDPLDWRSIMPIYEDEADPNSEILGWKVFYPKAEDHFGATNVVHTRWWSPLGALGMSPLRALHTTIASERAAAGWALANMSRAARPSSGIEFGDEVLKLDKLKRQEVYDNAVKDLRGAYEGLDNAGKLPFLPPGMKWAAMKHTTAVEAALIEQRYVNRNEVAAAYMLPPPMIGILDNATYSNIQTQREMAYTDGLAPPLMIIEQTLNAHVLRDLLGEEDIFVEFDFSGLLRGDKLKEIQSLQWAITSALLTPNEGRDVLNMPRSKSKGADKLWLQQNNLSPIDEGPPAKGGRSARASAGGGAGDLPN